MNDLTTNQLLMTCWISLIVSLLIIGVTFLVGFHLGNRERLTEMESKSDIKRGEWIDL
jgi:hypothetical protein